jgi:hypothetical protein
MPDIDAFEAEVNAKIKLLQVSKDANARRQAATWLGEAGDPSAITVLALAYKKDADKRVRDAAKYALGMFRALEIALEGDNRDEAEGLLLKVAEGNMGRRTSISSRTFIKFDVALLLSAVIVFALALVAPSLLKTGKGGTVLPDQDRATLLKGLQDAANSLVADSSKLQQQFTAAQAGTAFDCTVTLTSTGSYIPSPNNARDFPDVTAAAKLYNDAHAIYAAARTSFDKSCADKKPLAAADITTQLTALGGLMAKLPEMNRAIAAAASVQPTVPPAATLPPTAGPTAAGPTKAAATLPPTAPPVDIRKNLGDLQTIIDTVTDIRGVNTLLTQYWTEAKQTGTTAGCQETLPAVPGDYALAPDIAKTQPQLKLAVDLVNSGLKATRQGQALFQQACATGQPGLSADAGLKQINAAKLAFDTATTQIGRLKSG